MTHDLIILEGPDCSGKTTLGHSLLMLDPRTVYFRTTWSPALAEGIWHYHRNVLTMARVNVAAGRRWILDRSWLSELVYGTVLRPETKENTWFFAEEIDQWIQEQDWAVKYVYCNDVGVVERHSEEKDPDHPYEDYQLQQVILEYDTFFDTRHEDHWVKYDMLAHGHSIPEWADENL